jgi:ABC-type Mn2+/Zn2+ transport system ATPase subunit
MSAVLSFDRVSAGYRGRVVLNDVSVAIEPGRVTGLVGPNGAGKTTLLRVALGFSKRRRAKCACSTAPCATGRARRAPAR